MNLIKILPATKDYIWGGNKLRGYGVTSEKDVIAEAWICSLNKNGISATEDGTPLNEALTPEILGKKYGKFQFFPFLIKFIDSNDNLSIQVHPSDKYALKHENSFGKTEMWYVLEANEGSFLYLGLRKDCTPEEIENAIKNNTICDLLNKVPVKPGDCYFVEAGTIHAIGKGIVIAEIQQNSDLTYRIYDYDRVDKNGNHRELHIEKALKVINFKKHNPINIQTNPLGKSKYFVVNKISNEPEILATKKAAKVIAFISGEGSIENKKYKKGDTFLLKAGSKATITGNYVAIETTIK